MQDIITKSCAAPSDDTELIMHLIRGEQNAQEEFVRRFQKLIRVVLSMRPLSRQEQEDLFQQVFVHLWENNFRRLHKWDSQKGRLCSFLGVVAARLAADYIRRKTARAQTIEFAECLNLPADNAELPALAIQRQKRDAIHRMLQELRPRDASLIRQRYFDSKTYREIAATLGMADNQIGVTLARAESRLRAKLRQSYPDLFD